MVYPDGRFILLDRLRALPGVVEAGGINLLPMGGRDGSRGGFLIVRGDDRQAQQARTLRDLSKFYGDPTRSGYASFRVASSGYFRAMGIPLVLGRLFDRQDTADAPQAALISESLARARWPNEDPLGVQINFGGMDATSARLRWLAWSATYGRAGSAPNPHRRYMWTIGNVH
jgi:hypothetical protein